jgi:hypothetical protein
MSLLDWVEKEIARIGLGGPGSGHHGHKGVKGKRGGSAKGSGGIEMDEDGIPVLSKSDRNLIERASEENANTFSSSEKKRLSQLIQSQPPLTRDKVVYRGIDRDADGRSQGEKWRETRFISTSTSKDAARRYSRIDKFVVSITLPKGYRVLDYSRYGYWGNDEILLDQGMKFESITESRWRVK